MYWKKRKKKIDEHRDLAVLDDVGILCVFRVAACVLYGVPLAAPHTGHAGHAPAGQMDRWGRIESPGWENIFHVVLGSHTHRKRCKIIKECLVLT